MTLRTSWAVQDAIDQEDARVSAAVMMMPGLRSLAPYGDMPIARAGFRPGYGGTNPGKVTMTGVNTCTVQPFQIVLPSRRGAVNGGAYIITSDSVETVTLETNPHPSYSRIDRLVVQQNDTFYDNTAGSEAKLVYVKGTAASTPALPPVPPVTPPAPTPPMTTSPDYFELARWTVTNTTTDLRTVTPYRLAPPPTGGTAEQGGDKWTVAVGGVLPVPNTASRDLLTAKGWAGLTVHNPDSSGLEVLSGPGGTWRRQGVGAPILNIDSGYPAGLADNTVAMFRGDLWIFTNPSTWTKITYNHELWEPMEVGPSVWPERWPQAKKINATTIQLTGLFYADWEHKTNLPNERLLCRLPDGWRPMYRQDAAVVTEMHAYISGKGGPYVNSKIAVVAADGTTASGMNVLRGQILFYRPDGMEVTWVSLDGVILYLDDPEV